jgi:nucleotidyltransferase/DNA polymerase involved in DNA repair
MIAPIDRSVSETGHKTQTLHSARRAAASALLDAESRPDQPAKPIARWQAWLFVAWTVIITATYFAHMLGLVTK